MSVLNVEKRDSKIKAKALRRNGMIPCNVGGGDLKESVLCTVSEKELMALLKEQAKGGVVTLNFADEAYPVIIKEVSRNMLEKRVENVTFQKLEAGKTVASVATVVLTNKDKLTTMAQILVTEIPYEAHPEHLIEQVEIDASTLKAGQNVTVGDLAIANDPDVELKIARDIVVINIAIR